MLNFCLAAPIALSFCLALPVPALGKQVGSTEPEGLDGAQRAAIIESLAKDIDQVYIFPKVATEMIAHLNAQSKSGAYDEIKTLGAFCAQLTGDLQSVSHDLHLRVQPMPRGMITQEAKVDQAAVRRDRLSRARRSNYGFQKIEIMQGNVGYLDLRQFADASTGGPTAIAAMNFLAGSDAIIVDLRANGGGSPSMIQLILSYFFEKPTHLNDFYVRSTDSTQQFWTHKTVQGPRMVDTPLYVLTSGRTFSAAEEFSYNVRNLKRATLFGENTGGGAHPVNFVPYPQYGISMALPFGRAINPITGTNWEGVGVKPHHEVPADQALDQAYAHALDLILSGTKDERQKAQLHWVLEGLRAKEISLTSEELSAYAGSFGPRRIWVENGTLRYQRGGGSILTLVAVGRDHFHLQGMNAFRIRFDRSEDNKVCTLVGRYDDGREDQNARTH